MRSLVAIRSWALDAARVQRNTRALRELERLARLADGGHAAPAELFMAQMKWAVRLGAAFAGSSWAALVLRVFLPSGVYSMADKIRYVLGARFSEKYLMPEAEKRDLFLEVPRLEVPAYFVHGRHDGQVPPGLTEEYVCALEAPSKRLLFLEHSAHAALFEEPGAFRDILAGTILASSSPGARASEQPSSLRRT